jgi:hypothetical protein
VSNGDGEDNSPDFPRNQKVSPLLTAVEVQSRVTNIAVDMRVDGSSISTIGRAEEGRVGE